MTEAKMGWLPDVLRGLMFYPFLVLFLMMGFAMWAMAWKVYSQPESHKFVQNAVLQEAHILEEGFLVSYPRSDIESPQDLLRRERAEPTKLSFERNSGYVRPILKLLISEDAGPTWIEVGKPFHLSDFYELWKSNRDNPLWPKEQKFFFENELADEMIASEQGPWPYPFNPNEEHPLWQNGNHWDLFWSFVDRPLQNEANFKGTLSGPRKTILLVAPEEETKFLTELRFVEVEEKLEEKSLPWAALFALGLSSLVFIGLAFSVIGVGFMGWRLRESIVRLLVIFGFLFTVPYWHDRIWDVGKLVGASWLSMDVVTDMLGWDWVEHVSFHQPLENSKIMDDATVYDVSKAQAPAQKLIETTFGYEPIESMETFNSRMLEMSEEELHRFLSEVLLYYRVRRNAFGHELEPGMKQILESPSSSENLKSWAQAVLDAMPKER